MQHKFSKQSSLGESIAKKVIKVLLLCVEVTFVIFLLDKISFPSPEQNIKKDISNEIIKLK